ncbi:HdeD family acid-resistance protein [Paracoccus stylophorae]|nr:HdeD family acid-resistance protein [Paracoccus stylophorae]
MSDNRMTAQAPGLESGLVRTLAEHWWLFLMRGILAIVFGILAFMWPALTVLVLTLLWGAYAVADGIMALWAAFAGQQGTRGNRWWLALLGVLGIVAGIIAFTSPGVAAIALLVVIAFWAIVAGIAQIVGAIRLRHEITDEWLLGLSGVLLLLFGLALIFQPVSGILSIIWLISLGSLVFGILTVMFAFKLRRYRA